MRACRHMHTNRELLAAVTIHVVNFLVHVYNSCHVLAYTNAIKYQKSGWLSNKLRKGPNTTWVEIHPSFTIHKMKT